MYTQSHVLGINKLRNNGLFPRDTFTLGFIKELESFLGLSHENIENMSTIEIKEYINQLTLKLMNVS